MYLYLKKNEATEIVIPAIDTADHDSFKSGISPVDTAYYKDGAGAWASLAITDTFAEIGSTGVYEISLTAAEMSHDWIMIKVSVSGMSDTAIVIKTYTSDIDDIYDRIGAPAGASIAADVADIPTVTEIRIEMDTNSTKMAPSQFLDDYKATGFAVPGEYDTQMGYIPSDLGDVPTSSELDAAHGAGSWEGIPGSTDWLLAERKQIRDALGVDGDKTDVADSRIVDDIKKHDNKITGLLM